MVTLTNKKLHEGKAKIVYEYDQDNLLLYFKDDVTAFNAEKKDQIQDKGIINLEITHLIYSYLENNGIKTHIVEKKSERELIVKKVDILPIEFVFRNYVAGSLAKRLGLKEGEPIKDSPLIELYYKNDDLGDPMINDEHAIKFGFATKEDLDFVKNIGLKINDLLVSLFDKINILLVDYKLEFGKTKDGEILLADEFSPDSARLWDKTTYEKLDKDRFRRDLGKVRESYLEVYNRIKNIF